MIRAELRRVEYGARARTLAAMGFHSYQAYLSSPLWAGIRVVVLARDPLCRVCLKRLATQVHHLSYSRDAMEGRDDSQLIGICGVCHRAMEYTHGGRGEKRAPSGAASRTVARMARAAEKASWRALIGPRLSSGAFYSDPGHDPFRR